MEEDKYTADSIRALDGNEHVRMRPKLYFEEYFRAGKLDDLPIEAACHAIDEYFDGKCDTIEFGVAPDDFHLIYNAGMRLDDKHGKPLAELIMTSMSTCSNEKKHLEVGVEFCKLGIATINAASVSSKLITVFKGKKGTFIFENGKTMSRLIEPSNETDNTYMEMHPDPVIFGDLKLTFEGMQKRVEELRSKLPKLDIAIKEIKK